MQFRQAKLMLLDDPNYKGGWKFDHVWSIIKKFEKFKDGDTSTKKVSNSCGFGDTNPELENVTSDSATQESPGLSTFSMNLDDEEDRMGGSSSKKPIGVKQTKLKRKNVDQTSLVINILEEKNKKLSEKLEKTSAQRHQHLEIQNKNYALKKFKKENKILFRDLNSIQDPNVRAYIQSEQNEILVEKNEQQQAQQPSQAATSFGQYFNNLSGSGNDLPDY